MASQSDRLTSIASKFLYGIRSLGFCMMVIIILAYSQGRAQTDPLRFFPLGDTDSWLFEATQFIDGKSTSDWIERWTVVGDTVIGGTERTLLQLDTINKSSASNGRPFAASLCAIQRDPNDESLSLTFTTISGECHNLLSFLVLPEYTVTMATDKGSIFPAVVDIGGYLYDLPEVAFGSDHVHTPPDAVYLSEWWIGRDLGLYQHDRRTFFPDSTVHIQYLLTWARVNGVVYGSIPVGSETDLYDTAVSTIQIWPNPAQSDSRIRFEVAETGRVRLRLVDSTGRFVAQFLDRVVVEGEHEIVVSVGGFASGSYLLCLEVDGVIQAAQRVVVAR